MVSKMIFQSKISILRKIQYQIYVERPLLLTMLETQMMRCVTKKTDKKFNFTEQLYLRLE